MTEEQRNEPACERLPRRPTPGAPPLSDYEWNRVERAGAGGEGCEPLLDPDWGSYIDRTLPRTAVQVITIRHSVCMELRDGQMVLARQFAALKGPENCLPLAKIVNELDWNKLAGLLAK